MVTAEKISRIFELSTREQRECFYYVVLAGGYNRAEKRFGIPYKKSSYHVGQFKKVISQELGWELFYIEDERFKGAVPTPYGETIFGWIKKGFRYEKMAIKSCAKDVERDTTEIRHQHCPSLITENVQLPTPSAIVPGDRLIDKRRVLVILCTFCKGLFYLTDLESRIFYNLPDTDFAYGSFKIQKLYPEDRPIRFSRYAYVSDDYYTFVLYPQSFSSKLIVKIPGRTYQPTARIKRL